MGFKAGAIASQANAQKKLKTGVSAFSRVAKFTLLRVASLFLTIVIALFLSILIANMGGVVDDIRRASIREGIQQQFISDPRLRAMAPDVKLAQMTAMIALEEERQGLNQPFLLRAFRYMVNALRLDLGLATNMNSDAGSREVKNILLERLPNTLLLWTSANMIMFFSSVFFALVLSRQYGSFWDKLIISLAPTSAAPAWFYGIFMILIFAAILKLLPFGGIVDTPPPKGQWEYALSVLKHLMLPMLSFTLAYGVAGIYNWRTFFLIFSSEDYVEMAKAKGLNARTIESRYILRPTLPSIITNFALLLVFSWSGAPIFETVFNWPGLGLVFFRAITGFETAVIVGETVIYSYLLAITVFLLDFVYALVDPRVRVGSEGRA
jgi:peptide/nickel transport system permease protein